MQAEQEQQGRVVEDTGMEAEALAREGGQEEAPSREALTLPAGVFAAVKGKSRLAPSHPLGSVVRQFANLQDDISAGPSNSEVPRLASSFWDPHSNVWASTSLAARAAATGDDRKATQRVERRLVAAAELAEREVHVQLQAMRLEHRCM